MRKKGLKKKTEQNNITMFCMRKKKKIYHAMFQNIAQIV